MSNYEQFVERMLADIRAGRLFFCHDCEWWCPMNVKCQDPWGGDWPVCINCLEDSRRGLKYEGEQPVSIDRVDIAEKDLKLWWEAEVV